MRKKTVATIALLVTMASFVLLAYSPLPPWWWLNEKRGAYVDEQWWKIITSADAQRNALITHEADAGAVPRPVDIPILMTHGFTILKMSRIGYTTTFENNRVWPFGVDEANIYDPWFDEAAAFRRAVHRLINVDEIVSTIYTNPAIGIATMSKCERWLPPGMEQWTAMGQEPWKPDILLPSWNPIDAAIILDNAGFLQADGLGGRPHADNPDYDPDYPGSAEHLRIDPKTGAVLEAFEYYTIGPAESSLGFSMALLMSKWFKIAGIPNNLVAGTYLGMVGRLSNSVLTDYQFMTGVSLIWGHTRPDILFDLTYSENLPYPNYWCMNFSYVCPKNLQPDTLSRDADYWGLEMMNTLNLTRVQQAAVEIQECLRDWEPYLPLLLHNGFTAWSGNDDPLVPGYPDGEGGIRIVNMAGVGALGSGNVWNRARTYAGRTNAAGRPINVWILGAHLSGLNPLEANTEPDWQILSNIFDELFRYTPFYRNYWWWSAIEEPQMEPWIGPGSSKKVNGNGVYDNPFNGTHYVSVGPNGIDETPGEEKVVLNASWKDTPPPDFPEGEPVVAEAEEPTSIMLPLGHSQVTYKGYGLTPITYDKGKVASINKVEVGVEGYGDGDDYVEVQTSWNGGANWTSLASYTPPTSDTNTTAYLDVTSGRQWTWDELNNTNFRVRIYRRTVGIDNTLYNDWIPVKVTTIPKTVTVQNASDYENNVHWTAPEKAYSSDDDYASVVDANPIGTQWHMTEPQYSRRFNITSWEDTDANELFDPSDQFTITFKDTGEGPFSLHLDNVYRYIPDDYWKPIEEVTTADLAGDDVLGMVTTWELREDLYWHDSDPGPDGKHGTGDEPAGSVHKVTTADIDYAAKLMMGKENPNYENVRYYSTWQHWAGYVEPHQGPFAIQMVNPTMFKVYEERRYTFAFEGHSILCYAPQHIWAPYVNAGGDPKEWRGWESTYISDPVRQRLGLSPMDLTYLIGFGPFVYHYGGFDPGVSVRLEYNPLYFAGKINEGDIDLEVYYDPILPKGFRYYGMVDMVDYDKIVSANEHGSWPGNMPYDNVWDPTADLGWPSQEVTGVVEISIWYSNLGKRWGPGYPP